MDLASLYAWGCLGGLVAAFAVYVVPVLVRGALTGELDAGRKQVYLMVLLVVVLTGIAGTVPLMMDVTERGQAIRYGVGSQAFIKAILSAARDTVSVPNP